MCGQEAGSEILTNPKQLTGVTQEDHLSGPGSASAVNLIVPPVHPSRDGQIRAPRRPRFQNGASKSVQFTAPTYHEHSGNEYSDDDDEYDEDYSQDNVNDGQYDDDPHQDILDEDEMMQHGHRGSAGFESDEESDDNSRDENDEDDSLTQQALQADQLNDTNTNNMYNVNSNNNIKNSIQQSTQQARPLQDATNLSARAVTPPVGKSVDELLYEQAQRTAPLAQLGRTLSTGSTTNARPDSSAAQIGRSRSLSSAAGPSTGLTRTSLDQQTFDPIGSAGTRKITLTPQIAQATTASVASSSESTLVDNSPTLQIAQGQSSAGPSSRPLVQSQRSVSNSSSISQAPSTSSSVYDEGEENSPTAGQSSKDKKKKSSGMFGGLFGRKKDKKNSPVPEERSSPGRQQSGRPGAFSPAPANAHHPESSSQASYDASARPRDWKDHDSSLAEETARRQQYEAKQAMQKNYGIQRQPGDQINTFTPTTPSSDHSRSHQAQTLSPPSSGPIGSNASGKARPGSLVGSPGVPGLDVPSLTVLRVFADESVQAEATFKTVLLSEATTAPELLKQALQRFRLPLDHAADFYLSIKETAGQEEILKAEDHPLKIIQTLTEALNNMVLPSIKRSSVSSISSIASNLSTHPAIEKLNMSDFSDDHAVKLFLYRRTGRSAPSASSHGQFEDADADTSRRSSALTVTPADSNLVTPRQSVTPNMRFALKITINSTDLPDGLVFDPSSQAILPKAALSDRRPSAALELSPLTVPGQQSREKLLFFPANATVGEVIENGLDQFGIVGGVVEGGDAVEDKVSKRRSMTRVRYALNMLDEHGKGESAYLLI